MEGNCLGDAGVLTPNGLPLHVASTAVQLSQEFPAFNRSKVVAGERSAPVADKVLDPEPRQSGGWKGSFGLDAR